MLCLLPLKRLERCGGLLGFNSESFELVFGVWLSFSASAMYQDIENYL